MVEVVELFLFWDIVFIWVVGLFYCSGEGDLVSEKDAFLGGGEEKGVKGFFVVRLL